MQSAKLLKLMMRLTGEVEKEINERLPRKLSVTAKNHYKDNFRRSGFVDGGLRPWQRAQRQYGSSTSAQYRTLTSARNHLMSSIEATPRKASVLVYNPVAYARIHNEGGDLDVSPTLTPKMRRFAWAKYYELGGKAGSEEAEKWKRLALSKKDKLHIHVRMPKRQFIGESVELRDKIGKQIEKSVQKVILNVKENK